jgi:NAD(P)-dependent dehydrogenase (short-subunit alcohol dehydrogenase family)
MQTLEGKVAAISGGTSGIGAAIAELFVSEGAKVVIGGRRKERGQKLADSLGEAAIFARTDVAVEADAKALLETAVQQFGRVDRLVNNVGIPTPRKALQDFDLEAFDFAMAVQVRGTLAGIKHAARTMIKQGSGSIINTASINGFRAGHGIDYSVAKAAVIHLTRCAANELGEKGIRVNTLSPGPIATGIFGKGAGLAPDAADLALDAAIAAVGALVPRWQPLQIVGLATDVAQAALFLTSDASRLIAGHNLVIDGGASIGWPPSVLRDDIAAFREAFQANNRQAQPK